MKEVLQTEQTTLHDSSCGRRGMGRPQPGQALRVNVAPHLGQAPLRSAFPSGAFIPALHDGHEMWIMGGPHLMLSGRSRAPHSGQTLCLSFMQTKGSQQSGKKKSSSTAKSIHPVWPISSRVRGGSSVPQ
jgi:hypothetical protein